MVFLLKMAVPEICTTVTTDTVVHMPVQVVKRSGREKSGGLL
jgi:hypothetical protein